MNLRIAILVVALFGGCDDGGTEGIDATGGTSSATGGANAAGSGGSAGSAAGGTGGIGQNGGAGGASIYPANDVWLEVRADGGGISSRPGASGGSCLWFSSCGDLSSNPIEVRNMGGVATAPMLVFLASDPQTPTWRYQFQEWGTIKILSETCAGKVLKRGESCNVVLHYCPTTPDREVFFWACSSVPGQEMFGACERLPLQCQ